MYQLYCYFSPEDKYTEDYDTYEEVVARIEEMKPQLEELTHYLLIINDPEGTQIQTVTK